jgi:hypothetical protein
MVIVLLIYPIVVAAGLFALDAVLPVELVNTMSSSIVFTAVLSLLVLTAVLAAAYRRKDNPVLMSAWLFLFCGLAVLSLGALIDPFLSGSESWAEELFSTASFFPLLFFSLYIASPLRLLILSRRQRTLYAVAGIVVLLAVFAIVFLPWLLLYEGPRLHASTKHLLRLSKPVLDTLLAEPIGLLVLVIGLTSGSGPYMFIGLGLMLFIPEDILDHFQLLRQVDPHGQFANLISIASRLYLLNGALLGISRGRQSGETR